MISRIENWTSYLIQPAETISNSEKIDERYMDYNEDAGREVWTLIMALGGHCAYIMKSF